MFPVDGLTIVGTQLDDGYLRLEEFTVGPRQFFHIRTITFVQHGTPTHTIVLHVIISAQHLLQLPRIGIHISKIQATASRDAVADTCHTDSISLGRLDSLEPHIQQLLHLVVIGKGVTIPEAVVTVGEDIHRGVDMILAQCLIIGGGIGVRGHRLIVVTREDKRRRCDMALHLHLVGILLAPSLILFLVAQEIIYRSLVCLVHHRDDGVEQYLEIRALGIHRMGGHCRYQMTAGREAHQSYVMRVDMPCLRTVAHRAYRLLGILDRYLWIAVGHAVFQ